MDMESAANTAESILEALMKIEPVAATIVSALVPGAAPVVMTVQPEIALIMPSIEKALKDVGSGHPENMVGTLVEFLKHITPGMPNSTALAPAEEPQPAQ